MLHADGAYAAALECVARRQVVGMQIVGDDLGRERQEPRETLDGARVVFEHRDAVEIADVGAEHGFASADETERVLQLRAAGEDRALDRGRQLNRPRHVAASAAQHDGLAGDDARHGIVAARDDLAVVDEEEIRDPASGATAPQCCRRAIGSSDRLPDVITSGTPGRGEQQVVQGGVRQQYADERIVRREQRASRAAPRRRDEHDRPFDGRQKRLFGGREVGDRRVRRVSVRTITANGFSSRCLRSRSRAMASSDVASQASWKPPTPLTATIEPVAERARRVAERIDTPAAACRPRCDRSSRGPHTGQAFGWAWKRRSDTVVVLALARRTHLKRRHRRRRPVVGRRVDDREARPAVRAVRERVAKRRSAGSCTLGRGRPDTSRDPAESRRARSPAVAAGVDREVRPTASNAIGSAIQPLDRRRRRTRLVVPERARRTRRGDRRPERLDGHACGVVADAPA